MGLKEAMRERFGEKALKRPITLGEVYELLDAVAEKHNGLSDRITSLEAHGIKYVGAYQRAASYRRGEVVTADGAMWIALRDAAEGEAPGKAPDAWQLAQKNEQPARKHLRDKPAGIAGASR